MELRTCKSCKRIYNHFSGQNLCPDCVQELDKLFLDVKDYVYDHPNVGIQEVAEKFEISVKVIHNWIREERLEFSSTSEVGLPCESCGAKIQSGRFCGNCKKNMIDGLSGMYSTNTPAPETKKNDSSNKMRFF